MKEKVSLELLLSSYKFTEPVSPEIKKQMLRSRKKTIIHILKKNRQYGIISFLIISLFFLARKSGITLSIMKATIAAWTTAIVMTAAITGAAVYTVHYIIEKNTPIQREIPGQSSPAAVGPVVKKDTAERATPSVVVYHVGIIAFENIGVDKSIAGKITDGLKTELSSILPGKRIAVFRSADTEGSSIRNLLMGSVIRFGDGFRLTARVIDPVSSTIVLYKSEEIRSEDDIPAACRSFSGAIAGKLR